MIDEETPFVHVSLSVAKQRLQTNNMSSSPDCTVVGRNFREVCIVAAALW